MNQREQADMPVPAEERGAGEPPAPVDAEPRTPVAPPRSPPPIFDGGEHAVDPRSVKVARIIGISTTLLIATLNAIAFSLGRFLGDMPNTVYLALLGILSLLVASFVALAYGWPGARYERLRYGVEEDGLRIRRGVLWRKVICIPVSRIQHTDVSQGPVQRIFELATLTIHTAGTAGASISLAGLEHGIATRLCDHLRPGRRADAA